MTKKAAEKQTPVKPAAKKPGKTAGSETKPKTAKAPAAGKPAARSARAKKSAAQTSPEQIVDQIRVAAYYRWEQRGKIEGSHMDDWFDAEKDINTP
jgi:hypothetical protein